ncbi:MAG: TPM domain-containing protein [Candidatus Woesearchaeota archaeon]|nr:TPM domain-containing protein [Candidatus Woesearchaeota archaeon]
MKKLLLLLLCIPFAFALDIPSPGFVVDEAGLLTPGEQLDLSNYLANIEEKSTVEIGVLILPSLEDENLELFANEVFREWGLGKKDVNNGVLILIALEDRAIRIEVGTGLEGVLTDAAAGLLIRNRLSPAFKAEKYAAGLTLAAEDIWKLAENDPGTVSRYSMGTTRNTSAGLEFFIVLLIVGGYLAVLGLTKVMIKEHRHRKKVQSKAWYTALIIAWVLSVLFGSGILWIALFFLLMIGTVGGGVFFFPMFMGGGRGGLGGSGGFGGFGGGFSGGGGASGGW